MGIYDRVLESKIKGMNSTKMAYLGKPLIEGCAIWGWR